MRRLIVLFLVGLALAGLPACDPGVDHLEYVVTPTDPPVLRIYDIDNDHRLVRSVPIPELEGKLAGIGASAATDRLFISADGGEDSGMLVSYDLEADEVVWTRTYEPGVDALCVTPNGRKVYLSSGEDAQSTVFFVIDAADGDVVDTVEVARRTHNAVCSLDGRRAYLSSIVHPYVVVADTATNDVVRRVGPFGDGIRPFTINGTQTLVFTNVNRLLGFEVGDLVTGEKLYRVPVPGFPWNGTQLVPSHGIGITPDETRAWVTDSQNGYLHVFDITGVPEEAPTKVRSIHLATKPHWITFSLDGRFAYSSTGAVIDTGTYQTVARIAPQATKILEVDVDNDEVVRVSSRHGLGYVTG